MGLPFTGGSHRSRSMYTGLELLAYQQEIIEDSLSDAFSEHFDAGSVGLSFFDGLHEISSVFNEQSSYHSLPLSETMDYILTLAALKTVYSSVFFYTEFVILTPYEGPRSMLSQMFMRSAAFKLILS